jgi:hypothetical protein
MVISHNMHSIYTTNAFLNNCLPSFTHSKSDVCGVKQKVSREEI